MNKPLHIGILRADDVIDELANGHGQYPEMFEDLLRRANRSRSDSLELRFSSYAVNHDHYPADIDEVDGYILTGSKSSVYDDDAWITELGEFVRQLHQCKKKLLGICFGHQMVAQALGGSTQKSDRGWGIGVKDASFDAEAVRGLAAFGDSESFKLIYSHQDQVISPARGSVVLAGNAFCPVARTAIEEHVLTFQGHPEFSAGFARAVYDFRREGYPEDLYKEAVESLGDEADSEVVANWMIDFFIQ